MFRIVQLKLTITLIRRNKQISESFTRG